MPERWYGLLRDRMRVEKQRMRVIRDGGIIDHDHLEDLLARPTTSMRQAIGGALAREAA